LGFIKWVPVRQPLPPPAALGRLKRTATAHALPYGPC